MVVLAGNGAVMVTVPYGDGLYRVAVARRDRPWTREPVTLEELGELMSLSLGFDPEPYEPAWLARFKIHQRLADHYRTGRVLLAGDAAHLHSPLGGQGLNLGIQDAVNLGWKLAARIQGWAPPGLLDSYEAERRPQAARILKATDRATWMATSPSPRSPRCGTPRWPGSSAAAGSAASPARRSPGCARTTPAAAAAARCAPGSGCRT